MWGKGTGNRPRHSRPTLLADSSAQQEARCHSGAQAGSVGGRSRGVCAAGSQALAPSLMDMEDGNLDTLCEYGTCHGQHQGLAETTPR